ncbi:MAG TPA: molybdopterin-dependent oxidoreductase [Hyphomicrobiaceae bacterium]|nr:molybdopterin-dependent oxidoreductase [Hyphomicrobiaceae bacterium]
MADAGLPRGQRAIDFFPRFGVPAYAERWPQVPDQPSLTIGGLVEAPFALALSALAAVARTEVMADFHCVTTWTRSGLRWGGYRLQDVLDTLILPRCRPQPAARYLSFVSLDGYRTCVDVRDIDGETLLADRLDAAPLPIEHGAPIRLVAPALYGYKNPKHVCGIEFRANFHRGRAERQTLAHPRGRVAHEERGRFLPGRFYRYLYRALIPMTLAAYARADQLRPGGSEAKPHAPR